MFASSGRRTTVAALAVKSILPVSPARCGEGLRDARRDAVTTVEEMRDHERNGDHQHERERRHASNRPTQHPPVQRGADANTGNLAGRFTGWQGERFGHMHSFRGLRGC